MRRRSRCPTTRAAGGPVQSPWAFIRRMPTGSTTCATTSTSGAPTGTTRATTLTRPSRTRRARERVVGAPPAAALGGTTSKSRAAPHAPASPLISNTPTMAFEWPDRPEISCYAAQRGVRVQGGGNETWLDVAHGKRVGGRHFRGSAAFGRGCAGAAQAAERSEDRPSGLPRRPGDRAGGFRDAGRLATWRRRDAAQVLR